MLKTRGQAVPQLMAGAPLVPLSRSFVVATYVFVLHNLETQIDDAEVEL